VSPDSKFFYHYDEHGSVVQLTNELGHIVQTYKYDSFGRIVLQEGNLPNPFTYTGRFWDADAGIYHYRARAYDPETGRFLQQDPKFDYMAYTYANNDPVNNIDPYGEQVGIGGLATAFSFMDSTQQLNFAEGLHKLWNTKIPVLTETKNWIKEEIRGKEEANPTLWNKGVDYAVDFIVPETIGDVTTGIVLSEVSGLAVLEKNAAKGAEKVGQAAKIVDDTTDAVEYAGKVKKPKVRTHRLKPDPEATGPHSTYKTDPSGKVDKYTTWEPNPQNPSGYDEVKRYNRTGRGEYNKVTKEEVPTPHVHDPETPGGMRAPLPDEIPSTPTDFL
jgi:RHS repeat-associated protein